jgi:HK97 family phage major capsid protein
VRSLKAINEDLTAARERRDRIKDDAMRIGSGGELTQGEQDRAGNLAAGIIRVTHEIETLEDEARANLSEGARSGRYATFSGADEGPERTVTDRGDPQTRRVRDDALRSNERASFLPDDSRAHMEKTLRADDDPESLLARYVATTSDRAYFRAFSAWMRDPISGGHEWSPEEREAVQRVRFLERAMALGASGAYLVPYELDPSIIIAGTGARSPLRQIARVETTAYNVKKYVTSLGVTAEWTTENSEVADATPTLVQPTITCAKGDAFVPVSFELFEDSDIAQQIGTVLTDAMNVHQSLSFTLTQSNGPVGIVSSIVANAGANIIATASNVLAAADLYTNQAALPPRWRPNAKWMMSLPILNGYRQLALATGLNYSIVNDSGPIPTALGWPIFENSSMDSTLSGGAADYLVLSGDFKQFVIQDRVGTSIEVVQNLVGTNHRPTGTRGFLMHYRCGSDVLVQDAFRLSNFST